MKKVTATLNIVSKIQDVGHALPLEFYCKAMSNILFDSFSTEFIQVSSCNNSDLKVISYLDQGNEKDIAIFNSAKTFAETVSKGEAKVSQERGEGNATTTEEAVPF